MVRTRLRRAVVKVMSSTVNRHSGSLERSLQWALGLLVVVVLLSLTGTALWIGREGAEQFVASRLAHDAESLIAGLDLPRGEVGRSAPPGLPSAVLGTLLLGAVR